MFVNCPCFISLKSGFLLAKCLVFYGFGQNLGLTGVALTKIADRNRVARLGFFFAILGENLVPGEGLGKLSRRGKKIVLGNARMRAVDYKDNNKVYLRKCW